MYLMLFIILILFKLYIGSTNAQRRGIIILVRVYLFSKFYLFNSILKYLKIYNEYNYNNYKLAKILKVKGF